MLQQPDDHYSAPANLGTAVYANNADAIGNTPLVRLNHIMPQGVTVLAKIESRNPAFSVKCRIGAGMVQAAEQAGLLKPGMQIIEPTSGNTGIALAFVAAAKGYKITLTMPASMSMERRKVLAALGAHLVLTEPSLGMKGAVEAAQEIHDNHPGEYFLPQQFDNPANPDTHVKTTAPEIFNATAGKVDALVAGVGTGGTISGIARYFKPPVILNKSNISRFIPSRLSLRNHRLLPKRVKASPSPQAPIKSKGLAPTLSQKILRLICLMKSSQ